MKQVKILGHDATIEHVAAWPADGYMRKKDGIVVWLAFDKDKSVGNVLSFSIELPLGRYTEPLFIQAVTAMGELELEKLLLRHEQERDSRQARNAKQVEMEREIAPLKGFLGLK